MAKILIIDDDQDIIDSLTMVLERHGHTVTSKGDLGSLVDTVKGIHPDLIVLDIMWPEDSQAGFKAARVLRKDKHTSKVPILVLSAVNQRSNLAFGFSESDTSTEFMPVDAFLEKPVEPKVILEKIRQLLYPGHTEGR
ncbi:MAG: response regulator [Magnetococcales bacterium]|nr:response regulator [Magnetococcales bacterium]MBF0156649.1 response regulator [Magnetococcales bacterium]